MGERTRKKWDPSIPKSSQPSQELIEIEDSPPGPSNVEEVVPYLQTKKKSGARSYQSAMDSLHQSYGNQFVGGVIHKQDKDPKKEEAPAPAPPKLGEGENWAEKHTRAVAYVSGKYDLLASEYTRVALAYKDAYERHKGILDAENAKDKLATDFLFGALCATLGGVAGVGIGALVKGASTYVVEGMKGLAKYEINTVGKMAAGGAAGPMKPASKDPLEFYLQASGRLLQEKGLALLSLANLPHEQDPLSLATSAMAGAEGQLAELAAKDSATIDYECEQKIWIEWLKQYGWTTYTVEVPQGCMGTREETRTNEVDKDIVKYLSGRFGWSIETQKSLAGRG